MNLRTFLLTLVFAGVWAAVYFGLGPLLRVLDSLGILDNSRESFYDPLLPVVWIALLFPFLYAGELLVPPRFGSPALRVALTAANALLWGWCAAHLFLFVRRHFSRPGA